ncbi:flagellar export chaperone FlgN [Lachnospira multipara]|uniref:flagellar export chaperone FlgN n=1 Tax=Lachnospira multipara TaxID=28051 RepID=UPI0004E0BDDA|nr:flagellar export chaperone FlgN [Lachnospira multipara]
MENYLEILKDSLIKKIRILEEIVKIDDEQTTLFSTDKDNEDRIRETFDRKSALIDEINRMDAGFESVFEKVKEQLDNRKDEYKKEIKEMQELIKRITDLSMHIEAQEKRNKSLVNGNLSSMRKELSNAKRSTSLAKQYYSTMNKIANVDPQFMDSKR